jgi:hypothetical protein
MNIGKIRTRVMAVKYSSLQAHITKIAINRIIIQPFRGSFISAIHLIVAWFKKVMKFSVLYL